MNIKSLSFKFVLGITYLSILSISLYFLLSIIDIKDLMSYEFIRVNKDVILNYKNENFLLLTSLFFIFCIIWVLLLGFAMPLLLFAGFVFGKWWGVVIVLTSTTIGASLLYLLVGFFFQDFIKNKLGSKFSKLKFFFNKNELIYFTSFRFIGGGGTPYAVQNVLPILFDMSIKNYVLATFLGSLPSMFISVSLGSGIEKVIDQNPSINFMTIILSPEIYVPIFGFLVILIVAVFIKKYYFKE
jgi:uncharacterized membrane protein YdjX (TVP38/TMEM64 family)